MGELNFTIKALAKLPPREKRYAVFDANTRGLGLAVHPTGVKTFFHLKKVQGWPTRTTLGPFPDLSIEFVRGRAADLNAKLARWKASGFEGPAPVSRKRATVPTLGDAFEHYLKHHVLPTAKNPGHAEKGARWTFDRHLAPWKNRALSSIRREHVRERHATIAEKHGVAANRVVEFLRRIFNHAVDPDVALWTGSNPCAKPKKFLAPEVSRTRTLGRDEAPKFFEALAAEPNADLRHAVLLAIATGARRGTILAMRWDEIDLDRATWRISNPKGKKGAAPHVVPLPKFAMTVLRDRPRTSEWVFPGARTGQHLMSLKKPWRRFLKRAGIADFTFHDIRRSVATAEGEAGASTEVIQKTLGHARNSAATKIYDRSERGADVRAALEDAVAALVGAGKVSKRKLLAGTTR